MSRNDPSGMCPDKALCFLMLCKIAKNQLYSGVNREHLVVTNTVNNLECT